MTRVPDKQIISLALVALAVALFAKSKTQGAPRRHMPRRPAAPMRRPAPQRPVEAPPPPERENAPAPAPESASEAEAPAEDGG